MNKDIRNSVAIFFIITPLLLTLALVLWFSFNQVGIVICLALFTGLLILIQVYMARDNKATTRYALSELEAMTNIYRVLDIQRLMPSFGGYVINASMAHLLLRLIFTHKPKTIFELGSGASTLLMAYALKKIGGGKILSFDHEEHFAQQTRALIKEHELEDYAEIIHAPLKEQIINNSTWNWYDIPANVNVAQIDLLIADGPPAQTQKWARYPAFPFFKTLLHDNSVVVLDDTHRKEELKIAIKWAKENPDWILTQNRSARCAILSRLTTNNKP